MLKVKDSKLFTNATGMLVTVHNLWVINNQYVIFEYREFIFLTKV